MYDYPEFGEVLGGYYLRSLVPTAAVASGKVAVLKVEDPDHPATRMLGSTWPLNEEFYEFGRTVWDASRPAENVSQVGRLPILLPFTRDRVHVLLSLDTDRTDLSDLAERARRATTRKPGRAPSAAAAPSTRRSAIATTSGRTTRCSAPTSPAASAGRSASRTDVMGGWRLTGAGLVAVTWLGTAVAGGQGPAPLPTPAFHHLHLNSVNPDAAIDFYTRVFPTTSKDTFAGQPALKSPTDVWILFTRVPTPPPTAPPTAFWHFGWHVTDVRQSAERFRQQGVTLLPLYREEAGGERRRQQRHLAGHRRRAGFDQGRDCRGQGQRRAAGRRRRLRLPARPGRCADRVSGQPAPRAVQPHPHVARAAVLRAALVSAAPEPGAALRPGGRRTSPHRGELPGRARTRQDVAGPRPTTACSGRRRSPAWRSATSRSSPT